MEDLRTKEQIARDEGYVNKGVSRYTNHIPSKKNLIFSFIRKNYKKAFLIGLICLILVYPNEIGSFIGDWYYQFTQGLIENFK